MELIFEHLKQDIEKGMSEKDQFIPVGLPKIGKYANIRKGIFTLIFSTTGAGKSSFIDTLIMNACLYHLDHPDTLKPDFHLFSMERNAKMRIAKWISYLVFRGNGVVIEIPKMMGWVSEKLTPAELSLIDKQKPLVDQILNDYVNIYEETKTPNEVYKIMKDHFEKVGDGEPGDEKMGYKKLVVNGRSRHVYTPKNEHSVVIPIFDHGNLTKTSQAFPTKKQAIDKLVEYCQGFRDLEGAAPIWVAQVNRSITGLTRSKDGEFELVLDDVKESGDVGDACDIAISLFNPVAYNQSSKTGYRPLDFVDQRPNSKHPGHNYFRSAMILKSSYGQDSFRVPLAFNAFCGQFKELPMKGELKDSQYKALVDDVLNRNYFLNT